MKVSDTSAEQVCKLYIAGGFGGHINVLSAVRIGLIPGGFEDKVQFIGNGALAGAENLLLDRHYRTEIRRIVKEAIPVNLGGDPGFNECFIDHLYFDNCTTEVE